MISLTGAVILPFSLILYYGFVKTIPGKKRHPQMPAISKKGIGHEREDKTMAMTAFVKILVNRYLSKEEHMAIEARVFCRKPYDYYWEKLGRKTVSRATFYRRVNEGVDHLLMLLKRYYQERG